MEYKHFSHNHGLVFHQMPKGSEIHCAGCKITGSGNVYVCWHCCYFLHEQCFYATRSLKHPSHPLHPLNLIPYPTYPSASFSCKSCNLNGNGFLYSCSECNFDLHVHCALSPGNCSPHAISTPESIRSSPMPKDGHNFNQNNSHRAPQNPTHLPNLNNPLPTTPPLNDSPLAPSVPYDYPPQTNAAATHGTLARTTTTTAQRPAASQTASSSQNGTPQSTQYSIIKHFSHSHLLKSMEIDRKAGKVCSACETTINGSVYCCTESQCKFNLHKSCFDSPIDLRHKFHLQHPLKLLTSPPYEGTFTCDACLKEGKAFVYHCSTCSYDLHIDCAFWPEKVTRPDHNHPLTLRYSSPAVGLGPNTAFICDVCENPVHEIAWMYHCKDCDVGTHLECVTTAVKEPIPTDDAEPEEELSTDMELTLAMLLLEAQARAALQLL